jgi:hypothetical protein
VQAGRVTKLCILVTTFALSYGFGAVADAAGCDFFWSFIISGVGAILGCYLGWKMARRFFN